MNPTIKIPNQINRNMCFLAVQLCKSNKRVVSPLRQCHDTSTQMQHVNLTKPQDPLPFAGSYFWHTRLNALVRIKS